jgi:phosphatidylethanolamine/phosphatidyl-N-methylethanolamine N-methyltransferase
MGHSIRSDRIGPRAALDVESVQAAYRRWSRIYDVTFGGVSGFGRRRAVQMVNRLPGRRVLEVGVGTGLALPHYAPDKLITGIDLSADMLALAHKRVGELGLFNIEHLHQMDAEATAFEDAAFDVGVAMFVASVVPHPPRLLAEMRRVVRPGGHMLFVGHFRADRGPRWWVERAMAPASRKLGWHPDFAVEDLLGAADRARAAMTPVPPAGLFTLVHLRN